MWRKAGHIIKTNANYLWLGTAIFIFSALIGYWNAETIRDMAAQLLQELERIAERIEENNNPLYTFWVIFQNNVLASLSMLGLGVFLGIYPVLALLSNGLLLGFMLKMYALKGVSPLPVLVLGILPHGLIELFAVIFAASVGIKYGTVIFRMVGSLGDTGRRLAVLDQFKDNLHDLPFIVGSVIVLLFLAAVIETTVTPLLIHTFLGDMGGINE